MTNVITQFARNVARSAPYEIPLPELAGDRGVDYDARTVKPAVNSPRQRSTVTAPPTESAKNPLADLVKHFQISRIKLDNPNPISGVLMPASSLGVERGEVCKTTDYSYQQIGECLDLQFTIVGRVTCAGSERQNTKKASRCSDERIDHV